MILCLELNILCQVMLINIPSVITQQGSELRWGEDKHFPIHYLLLIRREIKYFFFKAALFLRVGESVLCDNFAALGESKVSTTAKIIPEL